MKQAASILAISLVVTMLLASCDNDNQNKAKQVQSAIKQNTPGSVPTTADGYAMNAKVNGKAWVAGSMMPPDAAGRIIGYNEGEYIGLPYDKRNLIAGEKITFSENEVADLSINDDPGMYGGRKGEMEITQVSDNWVEGKFFFTGSTNSSVKTIEVTDGFFRIPRLKN